MTNPNALQAQFDNSDKLFFANHPDRKARIRSAWSLGIVSECMDEFRSLGPHEPSRRAILVWRVSPEHPSYELFPNHLLKIPFLKFADETIEDRDDILLPIIDELMRNAHGSVDA